MDDDVLYKEKYLYITARLCNQGHYHDCDKIRTVRTAMQICLIAPITAVAKLLLS